MEKRTVATRPEHEQRIMHSAKLIKDSKAMIANSRQIILDSQSKRKAG